MLSYSKLSQNVKFINLKIIDNDNFNYPILDLLTIHIYWEGGGRAKLHKLVNLFLYI